MLRLRPEQSLEVATATLRAMQPDLLGVTPKELAGVKPPNLAEPFMLVPASAGTSGAAGPGLRQQYERPLLAMLIIVAFVLLIACANLANLLLARATARRHELSVRRALGASRWRLARQGLVESSVLGVLGAGVGLGVAALGSRVPVAQLSTGESPVTLDLSLDWAVLAYTAIVTVATVMFVGTVPALRAARIAPIEALKAPGVHACSSGGRFAHGRLATGGSSGLVIAQVAFSVVLMAAAGLFIRTFDRLASVPLGFDPDRVLVIDVDTARARVEPAVRFADHDRLVDAAASVPGVTHAAALDLDTAQRWRLHPGCSGAGRLFGTRRDESRHADMVRCVWHWHQGRSGLRSSRRGEYVASGYRQRDIRAQGPDRSTRDRRNRRGTGRYEENRCRCCG